MNEKAKKRLVELSLKRMDFTTIFLDSDEGSQ
jgi:hypothetical protein